MHRRLYFVKINSSKAKNDIEGEKKKNVSIYMTLFWIDFNKMCQVLVLLI